MTTWRGLQVGFVTGAAVMLLVLWLCGARWRVEVIEHRGSRGDSFQQVVVVDRLSGITRVAPGPAPSEKQ